MWESLNALEHTQLQAYTFMHLQCHAIFLLSSFERIYTHTHPACPICWTTFAVRSLAEQSAAVRSKLILAKLSCKTNLVWLNKWDYVLKKTSPYILNQIISNYFCDLKKKFDLVFSHFMDVSAVFHLCFFFLSLRPSFTVNLTECGPFRNPYRASLSDTPFSSTSLKCIKHLAPLTLAQSQQMWSCECFIGFIWISRPMNGIFTVGQNSKLATKRSTVNTFTGNLYGNSMKCHECFKQNWDISDYFCYGQITDKWHKLKVFILKIYKTKWKVCSCLYKNEIL